MWEAEIGRIMVPGQPWQKQFARPRINRKMLDMMACANNPNYSQKPKIGGSQARLT
jgi:hypothetical protein